jgi:large subunit ribosomal protein L21
MYAIVKNGGKQYKVCEGDIVLFDKMGLDSKANIELNEVLAVNNGELKLGNPFVDNAKVEGEVINEGKEKKVVIFKKRRRKDRS